MSAARTYPRDAARQDRLLAVGSTDGSAPQSPAANLPGALRDATDRSVVLVDVSTEIGGATKLLASKDAKGRPVRLVAGRA
jgi:hypothetical protein